MRGFNLTLAVILVLMLAFVAYFFIGGTLSHTVTTADAPGTAYPEIFESVQGILNSGMAPQAFSNDELGAAENYTLINVDIALRNNGIFEAEWLEADVTPIAGDVAVYSISGIPSDIPAYTDGAVNLKLITTANAEQPRTVTVSYYVLGMRRSIQIEF